MYTRISTGGSFAGAALYDEAGLSEKQRAQKLGKVDLLETNNLLNTDALGIAGEMQAVARRSKTHKPVWNISMSLGDNQDLSRAGWREAAEMNLKALGVDPERFQYAIYHHRDTKHDHIHILLNAVPIDGGPALSRQFNARKARLAGPAIEEALKNDIAVVDRGIDPSQSVGERLRSGLERSLTTATTPEELKSSLASEGIVIDYKTNATGIYGLTLQLVKTDTDGVPVKGFAHAPVKGSAIQLADGRKAKCAVVLGQLEANRAQQATQAEKVTTPEKTKKTSQVPRKRGKSALEKRIEHAAEMWKKGELFRAEQDALRDQQPVADQNPQAEPERPSDPQQAQLPEQQRQAEVEQPTHSLLSTPIEQQDQAAQDEQAAEQDEQAAEQDEQRRVEDVRSTIEQIYNVIITYQQAQRIVAGERVEFPQVDRIIWLDGDTVSSELNPAGLTKALIADFKEKFGIVITEALVNRAQTKDTTTFRTNGVDDDTYVDVRLVNNQWIPTVVAKAMVDAQTPTTVSKPTLMDRFVRMYKFTPSENDLERLKVGERVNFPEHNKTIWLQDGLLKSRHYQAPTVTQNNAKTNATNQTNAAGAAKSAPDKPQQSLKEQFVAMHGYPPTEGVLKRLDAGETLNSSKTGKSIWAENGLLKSRHYTPAQTVTVANNGVKAADEPNPATNQTNAAGAAKSPSNGAKTTGTSSTGVSKGNPSQKQTPSAQPNPDTKVAPGAKLDGTTPTGTGKSTPEVDPAITQQEEETKRKPGFKKRR